MNPNISAETVMNHDLNEPSFPNVKNSYAVVSGSSCDEKSSLLTNKISDPNSFISQGKRLLEWNKEKLTSRSKLNIEDLQELFAPEFVVVANGRKYDATYQKYYEFLNKFRSDIDTIDYQVQEYLNAGSTVVMPLKAIVKRLHGKEDIFDAILLVKFNKSGKIVHWQEVYSIR